jgi:hypothetical protein
MTAAMTELAQSIAGTRAAVETVDRERGAGEAGGIYLDPRRPSAEAYLEMHARRLGISASRR